MFVGIAYARDGAVCLDAMGLTIEYRWRQSPTHLKVTWISDKINECRAVSLCGLVVRALDW